MRPNILLITTDQHRADFVGCMGGPACTPHLDALAAQGRLFTTCTTNAPVCAAARCSLATGIRPHRLGDNGNGTLLQPWHRTYYQQLRDAGYHVGCVGKLDLAKRLHDCGRDGAPPRAYAWGFTRPCDVEGQGYIGIYDRPIGPYGRYLQEQGLWDLYYADMARRWQGHFLRDAHDNVLPPEHTHDGFIGRKAVEWLRNYQEEEPWHLFVSFVGPHDPYNPPTAYADRWRGREVPERVVAREGKPAHFQRRSDAAHDPGFVRVTRRQYCAKIEHIDHLIGELFAELKRRGDWDRTYILFSSDHGDMLGDHGLYTKMTPYEGALRVPLIIGGPGISSGRSDTLVEFFDCGATICDIAGVRPPEQSEARSFLPVARGERTEHRQFALATHPGFACVRSRTHKFVSNDNDIDELYDLVADPRETVNLLAGDGPRPPEAAPLVRALHQMTMDNWRWKDAPSP